MQGTQIDPDEEIRQVAYRIWQEAGCPYGSDLQHWLKAQEMWRETQLPKTRATPSKARKARKTRTEKSAL